MISMQFCKFRGGSKLLSFVLCITLSTPGAVKEAALAGYTSEAVDLIEFLYGDGMLELGGTEAVDELFAGIDLAGKTVLDIGSGIGGVDTYLAERYAVTIIGVEPEAMLVARATERASRLQGNFRGSVRFEQLVELTSLAPYPDESFDIVMSRGALLHVPHADKAAYFAEMLRVLKPGGWLVIDDWMHPSPEYTDAVKEMMEADGIPYHLITPAEYKAMLTDAGFVDVSLRDTTLQAYEASADVCQRAAACATEMSANFGDEMYCYAVKSWALQRGIFERRELLTGMVRARKVAPAQDYLSLKYFR